jgi:predicted negative regulator of RcsB-dependent stress response
MAKHLDLEEQEQLDDIKHFWKQYGNPISGVLIAVLGSFAAWNGYQYWQRGQAEQAAALFDEVERVSREGDAEKLGRAFGEMKDRFAATAYAPQAGLLVAKTLSESGKQDEAKTALVWVADKSKDPGYAAVGRLRLAGLQLEAKAYDEALKTLDTAFPEEFVALQADRRGDVYMAQDKKAEAKEQYLKAYQRMGEGVDYRRLVVVKLNSLGVDPAADTSASTAAASK